MLHAAKMSFNGDPNVGLYGIATDKFAIFGKSVPNKLIKEMEEVFKVPIIQANVYGTPLVGIFIAANSNIVIVPDVIFDNELEELKSKLKPLGIEVKALKLEHTALTNNVLANDKVGIISTEYDRDKAKQIASLLKIKAVQVDLMETTVPGSVGTLTNRGAVFGPNLTEKEIKQIEKHLKIEIGLGSVNMGSPLTRGGIIANSFGFVVGSLSSGYEISRVDESLGFLK